MYPFKLTRFVFALAMASAAGPSVASPAKADYQLFARSNLVAWCIVPFDAKQRGPMERAEMVAQLGLRRVAYDWRAQHVPTFEQEILEYQKRGLEYFAFWDVHERAFELFEKYQLHPQVWVTAGSPGGATRDEQVRKAAEQLLPIVERTRRLGCRLGLYNHGGWGGEPENLVAVCEYLRQHHKAPHVGIVYNFHHGHGHIDDFAKSFARMQPYLLCLNLNGMVREGDRHGRLILTLGQGDRELEMLRALVQSSWRGPVGILCHRTDADAGLVLADNLDGLAWLERELAKPGSGGPKPAQRAPLPLPPGASKGSSPKPDYWAVEDASERAKLPFYQVIAAARPEELTPATSNVNQCLTWHRSHGDNACTRFSALRQITRDNVTNLAVAWTYHSRDGSNNMQCNPIVVDGVIFAPTPGQHLVAVDGAAGVERWRYKPEGRPAFRGLVYWPGDQDAGERLLFCAGKFLYALAPKAGTPISSFGQSGRVELPGNVQGDFGAATAAPAVFQRTVVVPGFEKNVWGFDVVTGEYRWTFHTVPEGGEYGADTWDKAESYAANCWGGMALDDGRGIAYITTGSPKDNFIGVNHRGDNLFANCLVALDVRTGKRLWHFQEIRHDIWDMDIPAPPNLATIVREGRRVDVVAAVTKAGNTLLLDRSTGKPVFPFRMRRAPTSDLPGEITAAYQPDPELPEPFAKQEFTAADLTDRTPEVKEAAATAFKSMTTGWFRPASEGKMNLFFGVHGGAEWTGACVDPETARMYVSANHIPWSISVYRDDEPPDEPAAPRTTGRGLYEANCAQCHGTNRLGLATAPPLRGLRHRLTAEAITNQIRTGKNAMPANKALSDEQVTAVADFLLWRDRPGPSEPAKSERPRYGYAGYPKFLDAEGYPASKPPWGTLNCIDLNTGKRLWKVPLGEYEALTRDGVPLTGTENFGGASVTAGGLVFCAGTRDHRIRAFDKDTGRELWSAKLPWVGSAPPTCYEAGGRQYVVIAATGGGKLGTPTGDAYVAFALP